MAALKPSGEIRKLTGRTGERFTMREAIIHYWPEVAGGKPEMRDFFDLTTFMHKLESAHQAAAGERNRFR